jgi:hypothetical protein
MFIEMDQKAIDEVQRAVDMFFILWDEIPLPHHIVPFVNSRFTHFDTLPDCHFFKGPFKTYLMVPFKFMARKKPLKEFRLDELMKKMPEDFCCTLHNEYFFIPLYRGQCEPAADDKIGEGAAGTGGNP